MKKRYSINSFSVGFNSLTAVNNIKLSINQKKYFEYSEILWETFSVKKISFDDLFKLGIFKNAYDKADKDNKGYMIYSGKEFSDDYQLLSILGKLTAKKYKEWGLLESSTDKKYLGRGTYRFTELGDKFVKEVLGIK